MNGPIKAEDIISSDELFEYEAWTGSKHAIRAISSSLNYLDKT